MRACTRQTATLLSQWTARLKLTEKRLKRDLKETRQWSRAKKVNGSNMNRIQFDPSELCSRKLWEMVSNNSIDQVSEDELKQAIAELATRRHYLEKLQAIGAIEGKPAN